MSVVGIPQAVESTGNGKSTRAANISNCKGHEGMVSTVLQHRADDIIQITHTRAEAAITINKSNKVITTFVNHF